MKAKILALSAIIITSLMLFGTPAFAQQKELCEGSGGTWTGSECIGNSGSKNLVGQDSLIESIVNTLIFLVGVIAVIMLIVGAIRYAVSGGDANATKSAKDTILYAIVGIVVAAAAFAIVQFVITQVGQ